MICRTVDPALDHRQGGQLLEQLVGADHRLEGAVQLVAGLRSER